jgi:catechol 2,3-dioxygenase-like lactoylglutathione lyase family enzyme
LERSRAFYEALGLKLMPEKHGAGPPHYSARVGGTVLEFYPDASGSTRGLRLGLRLTDLAGAVSALAEIGFVPRPGSTMTIDDPDGHRIELSPALSNREDPLQVSGDIVNTRPSGTKPR